MARRRSSGSASDVALVLAICAVFIAVLTIFVKMLKMSLFGNLVAVAYIITFFMSEWIKASESQWTILILFGGLFAIKIIDLALQKAMGYR